MATRVRRTIARRRYTDRVGASPMELDSTRIDWASLEAAFCYRAPDRRAYFDVATGQVPVVHEVAGVGVEPPSRITAEPGRFLLIEPMPARDQHGWITGFIDSLEPGELREELLRAVAGAGAFRLFKQVLRAHHREVQRWFRFRSALLRPHIVAWLRSRGVGVALPRIVLQPPAAIEPGGEAELRLRQTAHAQLDVLPDAALDLAVSYLHYRLRSPA